MKALCISHITKGKKRNKTKHPGAEQKESLTLGSYTTSATRHANMAAVIVSRR
jgi:hypothetical protein